jgi:hypothetical protein
MSWTHPHPRLRGIGVGRARRSEIVAALNGDGGHLLDRVSYLDRSAHSAQDESTPAVAGPADNETDHAEHTTAASDQPGTGWASWPVDPGRATAALKQSRAYRSPIFEDDAEHAWSTRVDEALHGMDQVDSAGLDGWMQIHATSRVPHLYEARLVAAWETRQLADSDASTGAAAELPATESVSQAQDGDAWE